MFGSDLIFPHRIQIWCGKISSQIWRNINAKKNVANVLLLIQVRKIISNYSDFGFCTICSIQWIDGKTCGDEDDAILHW